MFLGKLQRPNPRLVSPNLWFSKGAENALTSVLGIIGQFAPDYSDHQLIFNIFQPCGANFEKEILMWSQIFCPYISSTIRFFSNPFLVEEPFWEFGAVADSEGGELHSPEYL